ncbi:synaptotagmin-like protein 2 isoform X5 [Heptranchias perlo]|uniref:synaptotagmin-like protein 2 isoform X5 n=1 Tax=Heptranchias perlo TaxID=212740 RepID=UPI00355937F7
MKGVMDSNLDLSFLTEDEYQTVLKVIQRDSELKKKDSERIRTAQKSIQDEKRRKLVTGQWFDEVKAKRYRNSLLGVDLIKASIRREKPIKHDITEKTESQQAHLTPSFPIPTLPETAKNEYTRLQFSNMSQHVSTDETTEESQSEEEKITARRKIKVKPGYPQDIQRKSLYDPRVSSSNESSPAAVAVETPVFPEKGQHRIPAVSSAESPTCEQAPDLRKQDNVAAIHYDRTQAYQADEISDQRTAPTAGSTLIPRAQRHLEFTEETPKAPGESEHSNLNGQRLATVSTVASPMQEKALDVRKPRKTVATRYNGAPTYQIPETSDQRKMAPSSITRIPKRRSSSRESETLSNEKPETLASEPGPQRLPAAILNEDQQAHQTIERSDQPPTSRIPRLKIALETAGETPKAPVEDLKPSSRMLPGSTYGLSPVMRALARAKKANAKSMDNLSSTIDRETITSVNENETKKDADDKPPVIHAPALEHARLKELSKSVPMLISESESDSASEVSFNFGWHRKTASDASHSSDMASVSSVSGSIMSVYSGDFGSIDTQGSVQFALDYSEKNKEFQIYVSQCKDLAIVDERKGRTDAYVKTYLLPDKARMGKRKTSVKRRNIKPLYNEILKYKIEKSVLLIQKLNLSVWHNDSLGRNSFLGEVDVDLASWDWSNRELNWYLLKSRIPAVGVGIDHRGEINLAIKYIPPGALGTGDPPTGEVHIWMKNAKDLPQLRSSGVDSFVKCYVLPDTSKKSYQKTRIVKKDTNPIYNHTIVYDGFRTEDLKEACVELTVWDHEKLTNHFLGGLRLGFGTGYSYGIPVEWMDSTEEEVSLWKEMMSNPNEWIPGSLLLRSQLGGKKLK